ncbi:hypothetical protein L484_019927 [Morus notabilis]|uniref:Uncharacterized protein n=1 Tax=Morus notabilis TaxID=981085 RepID=W9QUT5_9ROSA|nr:hypothetical protein L484_019927 [Morus notabilis]
MSVTPPVSRWRGDRLTGSVDLWKGDRLTGPVDRWGRIPGPTMADSRGTKPKHAILGLISTYSQEKCIDPVSNQQMGSKDSKTPNFHQGFTKSLSDSI